MQKPDPARTAFGFKRHIAEYQAAVTPIEKCEKRMVHVIKSLSEEADIRVQLSSVYSMAIHLVQL